MDGFGTEILSWKEPGDNAVHLPEEGVGGQGVSGMACPQGNV